MKTDVGLSSADSGRELLLPTRSPSVRLGNGYSVRAVHFTLASVQLGYAGYQILTRVALVNGIDPFAFSIYRNILAFLLLGPVAFCLERNARPKMTLKVLVGLNMLSLTSIVGCQQLFLLGLSLTTPMFAAVAQNMIPVFTFLLAVAFGSEEVNIKKRDGLAKIIGALICISGAITMTVYKGSAVYEGRAMQPEVNFTQPLQILRTYLHPRFLTSNIDSYLDAKIDNHVLGGLIFLVNTFSWALYLNIQRPIMRAYPALLSVTSFTYMFGFIQLSIIGFICEGSILVSKMHLTAWDQVVAVVYTGVVASCLCLSLQSWSVQKVGAFIVSLYMPVQMLMVAAMAIVILGDALYLGTLLGAISIVGGFYLVIYGQRIERRRKRAALEAAMMEPSLVKVDIVTDEKLTDLKRPLLP